MEIRRWNVDIYFKADEEKAADKLAKTFMRNGHYTREDVEGYDERPLSIQLISTVSIEERNGKRK